VTIDYRVYMIAEKLRTAKSVVVLTGAGVSSESGIRTFRDTMEGLWKEFDPAKLATPEAFESDPELVTRWYDARRLGCLAAEPNPGHLALAAIENAVTSRGGNFTLFTQNVDRLHQRAGSKFVVEVHGSIMDWRCLETGELFEPGPEPFSEFPPKSPFASTSILRPNVVWFGEALPEAALMLAFDLLPKCDLFFSIGTSSQVYPAAGFVDIAAENEAFTVEINKDTTPASDRVNVSIQGSSSEILPRLL
jgi:NAD-dependent deacetylase